MSNQLMDRRIEKMLMGLEKAADRIDDHENRLTKVENHMIVDSRKQNAINAYAKSHVSKLLGGKDSAAHKTDFKRYMSWLWTDYREMFGITSYRDTRAIDYDRALEWIDTWRPHSMRGLEETDARRGA